MKTFLENVILLAFCLIGASSCAAPQDEAKEVVDIIYKVNNYRIRSMGVHSGTMPPIIQVIWKRSS